MRKFVFAGCAAALLAAAALYAVQEPPKQGVPAQEKEQAWLQRFVGEWVSETEVIAAPEQPPETAKGTEKARSIGIWVVAENTIENPAGPSMTGILTIGYDPEGKKFLGTWIDSMNTHLWTYKGSLDATGNTLTLEAEGPSFADPAKTSRYRDVIEFKDNDNKVLTSSVLGENGEWQSFVTAKYKRKNP